MPVITLPDGSQRAYPNPLTVYEVALSIGKRLASDTLAAKVNDKLVDTSYVISADVQLRLLTAQDPEGLEVIRHSTAHLLAQAVKDLFPNAQVTIGPVIEDGFYYDFAFERPFTPEDLVNIEARMIELAKLGQVVTRKEVPRDEAIAYFRGVGEEYKAKIIEDIPANETLSLYQQGNFTDLCRGPHVPNTDRLKAFKLMKLAGAYWRGDSKNEMLQRIYGTAWQDKGALEDYLHRIEEAEKRDHRRIGKALDLFHFQEEAPGIVFWHHNGYVIYKAVESYMREKLAQYGYQEIRTPQVVDRSLWEKSGHWSKYRENMFTTESESHDFALKPMNCPCHVLVYNQGLRSYRELPLRLSEFGVCHRNEHSGTLHGLMRVRAFVQDDAHIFCTEDQIATEIQSLIKMVHEVYGDFGFSDIMCKLSTRPDMRVGEEAIWDKAEHALQSILETSGMAWEICPGDGAFYGPKIDFVLKDCLGRSWQCGTIQLDFSMPNRLGAVYVAEDGERKVPVMIHRAILGSMERFIGVLIEHYAGKLPLWLAPTQVVAMNITDTQAHYTQSVVDYLTKNGIRAKTDLRNEKIGFKIREHTLQRIPLLLVIGDREVASQTVAVRTSAGKELGSMTLDALNTYLQTQLAQRCRSVLVLEE